MKFAISLALVALLMVSASDALINGVLVPHKPYFARITYRLSGANEQVIHNMAGSIISDRVILTSAFAFGNSFDFNIFIGSNIRAQQTQVRGTNIFAVSSLLQGPALITLESPIIFTNSIRSIRMTQIDGKIGALNEQGMVLGMGGSTGVTQANVHAVFMRITATSICQTTFPSANMDQSFCAFDIDANLNQRGDFCPQDRGSAITILNRGEEVLVGVAVEGFCGQAPQTRPSLFVRISHFRSRINEILEGFQIPIEEN